MALQRTLSHRLFPITRTLNLTNPTRHSPIFSSPYLETLIPPDPAAINTFNLNRDYISVPEKGFFRRFLQKRTFFQSEKIPEVRSSLPIGEKLVEKIKGLNVNRDRIRLDGLNPPPSNPPLKGISVEDARKLLKLSQLEMVKSTLRRIPKKSISYSEFVKICVDSSSSSDQGLEFAKTLDESGAVIVLGNVVFLQPEQVTKAIQSIIPLHKGHLLDQDDDVAMKKELEMMEEEKMKIDIRAEESVRRELWGGLGFLVLQTAAFMRLTFWELSWDVMEPICFFLTSIYGMAAYTFFLRTSRDPSFEGFFKSRFASKQKRLMAKEKFDVKKYNELKSRAYDNIPYNYCCLSEPQGAGALGRSSCCSPFEHSDHHRTSSTLTCALHH